jgi:hypothetical protein
MSGHILTKRHSLEAPLRWRSAMTRALRYLRKLTERVTKRWICRNQTLMLEFIPVENGKREVKDPFKIDCRTRRLLELRVCLS